MKKIARIITPVLMVAALLVAPLSVQAQVIDVPSDEDPVPTTGTLPETGASAPQPTAAPDTGFGPSDNMVVANLSVFVVGGLMGAALGYGIIFLKKRYDTK